MSPRFQTGHPKGQRLAQGRGPLKHLEMFFGQKEDLFRNLEVKGIHILVLAQGRNQGLGVGLHRLHRHDVVEVPGYVVGPRTLRWDLMPDGPKIISGCSPAQIHERGRGEGNDVGCHDVVGTPDVEKPVNGSLDIAGAA